MTKDKRLVRLTDEQIAEHINAGLVSLGQLCRDYDDGYPYIAFAMATEVERILTNNQVTVRLRGTKIFTTIEALTNEHNVMAENKLIFARVGGEPPVVDFIPTFKGGPEKKIELLAFRDWWNRDVIHRASAAPPDWPPLRIPLDRSEHVPYQKRATLCRREFVSLMRNKLGAHLDEEIPEVMDQLQKAHSFGTGFVKETPDGELNTWDGTLPVRAGPAAAMMRQISHEVLTAYGFRDEVAE